MIDKRLKDFVHFCGAGRHLSGLYFCMELDRGSTDPADLRDHVWYLSHACTFVESESPGGASSLGWLLGRAYQTRPGRTS